MMKRKVMNKKGISAVVATVLIILITVAAVAIVWAAVVPMFRNKLESGTVCFDAVSQVQVTDEFTCYDSDTNELRVRVSSSSGDIDLTDLKILVYSSGNSYSYEVVKDPNDKVNLENGNNVTVEDLPTGGNSRVFVISGISSVDEVTVSPVILVGNSETSCEATSSISVKDCI